MKRLLGFFLNNSEFLIPLTGLDVLVCSDTCAHRLLNGLVLLLRILSQTTTTHVDVCRRRSHTVLWTRVMYFQPFQTS